SMRLFSWNINGIAPYLPTQSTKITSFFQPSDPDRPPANPPSQKANLRAFLARHNWPEVLFLQELKLRQDDTQALAALLASLNTPLHAADDALSDSRTYTLDAVLPRDKHNARGFQGRLYGVGVVLRTDFARRRVARVRPVSWDLEGRVCVVELKPPPPPPRQLQLQPQQPLNIYAVNGTAAPYRDPRDGRRVLGTRHEHKRAFHARLRDECLALQGDDNDGGGGGRGFDVVVAGDANVARGAWDGYPRLRTVPREHQVNRADFNAAFFGEEDNRRAGAYVLPLPDNRGGGGGGERVGRRRCLDAVDVFRALHGPERRYTYYPRSREWGSSCDRVDMVMVSRRLWEAGRVLGTGILDTPQERGLSDHVPLWVEI
ncbi:uncharacterized protein THITE_2031145, partial [Thermothielavioides terrestris NRRL 8126]